MITSRLVDVEKAIRSRRTVKAFEPEPVDRETLEELLELARWAPNHNLTNPWRFRVLGPRSLARLKERPPSLPPRSAGRRGRREARRGGRGQARPRADARRLLGDAVGRPGPGRGGPLRDRLRRLRRAARRARPRPRRLLAHAGRAALRSRPARRRAGPDEHFIGLLHLGHARQDAAAPERDESESYVSFLE